MTLLDVEVLLRGVPWTTERRTFMREISPKELVSDYENVSVPDFPAMAQAVWEVVEKEQESISDQRHEDVAQMLRLLEERDVLRAEVERLRGALEEVEWVRDHERDYEFCPSCNVPKPLRTPYRHEQDCALFIALGRPPVAGEMNGT